MTQQPITDDQFRAVFTVLGEVGDERLRQHEKWGQQDHPDGTGPRVVWGSGLDYATEHARMAKWRTDRAATTGQSTYRLILLEEVAEAFECDDPAKLRAELIQVAAVAIQWIEAIDRRGAPA